MGSGEQNKHVLSGGLSTVVRGCLIAGLVYCIYAAARQGISAWYLRHSSSAALERALRWDPKNPRTFNEFGTLTHMYADSGSRDKIIEYYGTATRLSPQNAQYWSDLGAAYDWAGRPKEAAEAFQHAQQLFPNSPEINWRIANFELRRGKTSAALQSLRKVLLGGSISRREVFELCATASTDNGAILTQTIPLDSSVLIDFLNFRISHDDVAAAQQVWNHLLESKLLFSSRDVLPYLDILIRHRKLQELQQAWSIMAGRFPTEINHSDGNNLVVNGGFESQTLNGGLDWRIVPIQGAEVSIDSEHRLDGDRSLRIDFDSTANPYYCHVFQYVRVKPETRYHFSGHLRVKGITTERGPGFEILDAYDMKKLFLSSNGVIGTADWSTQEFDFRTPPTTELLVVRVGRQPSEKIANKIGGTVWIDKIELRAQN
jgi:Carbohydrate binding domain/Tetratricopeptide repeat